MLTLMSRLGQEITDIFGQVISLKQLRGDDVSKKKTPPDGFNTPFRSLPEMVQRAGIGLGERNIEEKAAHAPPAPAVEGADEFRLAMEGVSTARWRRVPATAEYEPTPVRNRESEDRRLMEAAMDAVNPIAVQQHPEYIEGWAGLAGKQFLPQLRNGLYSIQGQLDLHGMGREQARLAVEAFVEEMSRFSSCCVKIIHGRGINSPHARGVLKENLQRWLATRRLARHVVAYASAQPQDGGVGAIYLLLRRAC